MNETAVQWLAFIGAAGTAAWIVWGLKLLSAKSGAETAAGPSTGPRVAVTPSPSGDDAAVIAAAVYAVISSGLTVRVNPDNSNKNWVAEGRLLNHASHRPH